MMISSKMNGTRNDDVHQLKNHHHTNEFPSHTNDHQHYDLKKEAPLQFFDEDDKDLWENKEKQQVGLKSEEKIGVADPRTGFANTEKTNTSSDGEGHWEATIGRFLLRLTTARRIVSLVLLCQYFLLLLGAYQQGTTMFCIMLFTCVLGVINNSKYVRLSFTHSDDNVGHSEERNRVLISLAIFSFRYCLFPELRIVLVPLYLLIVMSSNVLSINSWFYTLAPIYFTLAHFGCSGVYGFIQHGISKEFYDNWALFLSILIFSYYVISTSVHLRSKLDKLEQTTAQLENALSAKSVFLRHISHEFRFVLKFMFLF